jgi:peptidoglycan/xylan/chitin deacetylase (PgdA/CDA1 family)
MLPLFILPVILCNPVVRLYPESHTLAHGYPGSLPSQLYHIPPIPVNDQSHSGPWDFRKDITTCFKQNEWVLTFDDGPGTLTPFLLDQLKQLNIKATFFVVGSNVQEIPYLVKRAADEGHDIGVHTWSHPYLTRLSNDQIISELMWTAKIIYDVTGKVPRYMRPPYGDIDDRVRYIVNALGFEAVIWNRDTNDVIYLPIIKSIVGASQLAVSKSSTHHAFLCRGFI